MVIRRTRDDVGVGSFISGGLDLKMFSYSHEGVWCVRCIFIYERLAGVILVASMLDHDSPMHVRYYLLRLWSDEHRSSWMQDRVVSSKDVVGRLLVSTKIVGMRREHGPN
jgi:hypothetical protein